MGDSIDVQVSFVQFSWCWSKLHCHKLIGLVCVCVHAHKCALMGWWNINYTDVDQGTKQTIKIERNLNEKYFKNY